MRQSHTAKPDEQKKRKELETVLADPEEEILMALAQIKVVDGVLFGQAENSEALELEGMAAAACRLTQASLDTFERLDVVRLFLKARAAETGAQAITRSRRRAELNPDQPARGSARKAA